jgi:hypothetical protein
LTTSILPSPSMSLYAEISPPASMPGRPTIVVVPTRVDVTSGQSAHQANRPRQSYSAIALSYVLLGFTVWLRRFRA